MERLSEYDSPEAIEELFKPSSDKLSFEPITKDGRSFSLFVTRGSIPQVIISFEIDSEIGSHKNTVLGITGTVDKDQVSWHTVSTEVTLGESGQSAVFRYNFRGEKKKALSISINQHKGQVRKIHNASKIQENLTKLFTMKP